MSAAAPLVVEIKGHSLDDGPGIRSVVFFKGCPLSCTWCHNPEAGAASAELSFDPDLCARSLACVPACEPAALDPARTGAAFVDRGRCTRCFACVPACPSGALAIVGRAMTPDDVVAAVARYERFFAASGGGVTLSGGEPLMFVEYAGEVLARLAARGVHTLVETCGQFALDRYEAHVEPHVRQLYFDLKLYDADRHLAHCGAPNARIVENFRELVARARHGGVPVLPRVPLVPGVTDDAENLDAIASLLREVGATRVELVPYHPLFVDKLARLGRAASPHPARFLGHDEIARCRARFAGLDVVGA